jgi:hypothetical protein
MCTCFWRSTSNRSGRSSKLGTSYQPMDNNVFIALIGAGSSGLVAITALILNYRGFISIDNRFAAMENRFTSLETRLDRRLESMQTDMKDLNQAMTARNRRGCS